MPNYADMTDAELDAALAEAEGDLANMTDAELDAAIAEAERETPEEEEEKDYELSALDMVNPLVHLDAVTGVGADLLKASVDSLGRAGAMIWTEAKGAADYNIERWKTEDPDAYPPRDRTGDPVVANMEATSSALNRVAPRGTGFTEGGQVLRDAITGGVGRGAQAVSSFISGEDVGEDPQAFYRGKAGAVTDNPYMKEGLATLASGGPFAALGPMGKLAGKGLKAAKGGLTPAPTAPPPRTPATTLREGKPATAAALVEQNLDPEMMPAAVEAGIDPTRLPPSAFMEEGPAQTIVAAGEKHIDNTMANDLNAGVADVLTESADKLLEDGRSLRVQNNIPSSDNWANNMTDLADSLTTRATQYRDYVDANVRPGDRIATPAADNIIAQMVDEVGGEVDSLPTPLQPAAKRIVKAQEQLRDVDVQYQKLVDDAQGDPLGLRMAEVYKQQTASEAGAAANTRQFTFQSSKNLQAEIAAVTEGRKYGSMSEVDRTQLRDIGNALGEDRLAHLERGGDNLKNGPMLVEAQRQSNQLFDQKFRVQDNLLEVTTDKFNTSLQEVFGAAVTKGMKAGGSLGNLRTLIQRVRNPTRKPAVKPGATPRTAPRRRTYNEDVENMVSEGISNIVDNSGSSFLAFTQRLDKNSVLKKLLYDELEPDKVKAFEAYNTAGTKIARSTKTKLGSTEFNARTAFADGYLRKFISGAASIPLYYTMGLSGIPRVARIMGVGKRDAGAKMAKLFNNPVFLRIGVEASKRGAVTQSMVVDAAKLEKLKVWTDYVETLPPEMKAIAAAGGVLGLLNAESNQTD